jgi:hypothetical protein
MLVADGIPSLAKSGSSVVVMRRPSARPRIVAQVVAFEISFSPL